MKYLFTLPALMAAGCVATTNVAASRTDVSEYEMRVVSSAISYLMKDPESTRFRNWEAFSLGNGDRAVCVQANGKNSFGAYAGYSQYYTRFSNGDPVKSHVEYAAEIGCSQARSGTIAITSDS